MATYKEIHGVKVQHRSSDATVIEGDVWYNASTGKLKMYTSAGSWATGGTLGTARYYVEGCGTQTAAIIQGGSPGTIAVAETYDGSSWTEVADLNQAKRQVGSTGTQTAALCMGGQIAGNPDLGTVNVESWNGTSWTEIANLTAAQQAWSGTGTTTAAFGFGGGVSSPSSVSEITQTWDGSSWTADTGLNTDRKHPGGAGATSVSALAFGGGPPGTPVALNE